MGWGLDRGVPMPHVIFKKWQCRPGALKVPYHPVAFKKVLCHHVDFKKVPCRISLRPKMGCVAMSILGVYTHMGIDL